MGERLECRAFHPCFIYTIANLFSHNLFGGVIELCFLLPYNLQVLVITLVVEDDCAIYKNEYTYQYSHQK